MKYHERRKLIQGFEARKHPLYSVWSGMKTRCYKNDDVQYKNYGGRGITVCDEWKNSFEKFALDMGLKPQKDFTLERINNELGYSKENCKWASRSDQCLNRRLFKINNTGQVGVKLQGSRYLAYMNHHNKRYNIGYYDTIEEASEARIKFQELYTQNKDLALNSISRETVWCTSKTGIKGIFKHSNGKNYVVRVENGKNRKYLGFYKTLEEAIKAKESYYDKKGD